MKSTLLFLLVIFSSIASHGQEDLYVWKAGMWTGITAQQNNFTLPGSVSEPAYGIEFSRKLSQSFSLNSGFGTNVTSANMLYSSLNFKLNNGWIMKERARLSPFLGAGASYIGLNDINTEHFNVFTEAGLKLKINERISTGLSYVVFIPESKINFNSFPDKDLSQAIKFAVSFHFGDKSKSYRAPQFYSTTLMDTPVPVAKKLDIGLSDSIPAVSEKKPVPVKIAEPVLKTKPVNNLKDSIQANPLPDSSGLAKGLIYDEFYITSIQANKDSSSLSEMNPSDSVVKILDDSTKVHSISEPVVIGKDSFLNETKESEFLLNNTGIDSVINLSGTDNGNNSPQAIQLAEDRTGDVHIHLSDSTIILKMDQDKSLIIKFQPQYILPAANPNPTITNLSEEIPLAPKSISNTNPLTGYEPLAPSYPLNTATTNAAVLPYNNEAASTNPEEFSSVSPIEKSGLTPAFSGYTSPAAAMESVLRNSNEKDSIELFYIKEQNKLLIDILKHLSGVNKPDEVLEVPTLDTLKVANLMPITIVPIISEDSIVAATDSNQYEKWNAKVVSLERNIELLNEKLAVISEKLASKDSLLKPVQEEKQILTPEPEQTPNFRVEYPANIFYEINETSVHPEYNKLIENISFDQIENPEFKVMVSGFTDKSGNSEYNKLLSLKRAELLKAELISLGVSEGNIYVIGFGEKNAGESISSKLERRTEIRLIKIMQ